MVCFFVYLFTCNSRDESRERSRKKSPDRSRKSRREEKEEKDAKRKKKSVSLEDEKPRQKQRQDSERWDLTSKWQSVAVHCHRMIISIPFLACVAEGFVAAWWQNTGVMKICVEAWNRAEGVRSFTTLLFCHGMSTKPPAISFNTWLYRCVFHLPCITLPWVTTTCIYS